MAFATARSTSRQSSRHTFIPISARPLAYWHLLSLDAPSVAAAWTVFIARCAHVALPLFASIAMFLAVWIIYAADRLLDARLLDARLLDARLLDPRRSSPNHLEARHLFHARHARAFRLAILAASLALIPIIFAMPPATRRAYLALALLLAVWFAIIHRLRLRLPKELAVGIFFSAAIFIPTLSRNPALLRESLFPALILANLCSLNCLFIYAWEQPRQRPHPTTRFGLRRLQPIALVSILLPLVLLAFHRTPIYFAASLAAALLLALHRVHSTLHRTTLRAAADLALLTPLLFLPFLR